jgi:hypothetical protein
MAHTDLTFYVRVPLGWDAALAWRDDLTTVLARYGVRVLLTDCGSDIHMAAGPAIKPTVADAAELAAAVLDGRWADWLAGIGRHLTSAEGELLMRLLEAARAAEPPAGEGTPPPARPAYGALSATAGKFHHPGSDPRGHPVTECAVLGCEIPRRTRVVLLVHYDFPPACGITSGTGHPLPEGDTWTTLAAAVTCPACRVTLR